MDERELAILTAACQQADDVAALQAAIADRGVELVDRFGERKLNPVVTEARHARIAFARLLGELDLSRLRGWDRRRRRGARSTRRAPGGTHAIR